MLTNTNSSPDKKVTVTNYWAHLLNINLLFAENGFDLSKIFDFTLIHEDLFIYQNPFTFYNSKLHADYDSRQQLLILKHSKKSGN